MISQSGDRRTIEYQLVANAPQIQIGWILLGSMRVERDLGYSGRELGAYEWPTFRLQGAGRADRESRSSRSRRAAAQLGYLGTGFTTDLRARLEPDIVTTGVRDRRGVTAIEHFVRREGRASSSTSAPIRATRPFW